MAQRHAVLHERHAVLHERHAVLHERHAVLHERHAVLHERRVAVHAMNIWQHGPHELHGDHVAKYSNKSRSSRSELEFDLPKQFCVGLLM